MAGKTILDLYVRGKEVTIAEGCTVWVQKMNPVEHSQAARRANAARAKVLACRFQPDCDEYQAILNDVLLTDRSVIVDILCITEDGRISPAREAKVATEDRWKNDNYLEGLRDLWLEEMSDRFTEDPEDLEAKRVHDEIEVFFAEVRKVVDAEVKSFRVSLEMMTEKELIDTAMEQRIKSAGDVAWVEEYHRSEMSLGTRKAINHREKVFQHRGEVDELQLESYVALITAFGDLNVDPTEGKDSAVAPPSSPSSEQSEPAATAQPSGPDTAAA